MKKTLLVLTLLLAGCGAKPVAPLAAQVSADQAQAQGLFNHPVQVADEVNGVMAAYDHNRNGQIDAVSPGGVWSPYVANDERTRKETLRTEDHDARGNVTRVVYLTYTYARRDMFAAADANHDAVVTREELSELMASFDKDHDGLMTRRGLWGWLTRKEKGEYDLYQGQYGEEVIDTHRDVVDVWNRAGQQAIEKVATIVTTATPKEDLKTAFDTVTAQ